MAMNKAVAVFLLVAVFLMAATPQGHALSCGEIQSRLSPCLSYLTGGSSTPSQSCCSGLKSLTGLQSTQDRQTACNCMKSAASGYNVGSGPASSLPGKCGVSAGYSIGPNTDCSKIA